MTGFTAGDTLRCPYCDHDVQIEYATNLATAVQDGLDRRGWWLVTHYPTRVTHYPGRLTVHQWTTRTDG